MKHKKLNVREISTNSFLEILDKYKNKVSKSEMSSKTFLVELGVITEKGNLRKNYKDLCIPKEQV